MKTWKATSWKAEKKMGG